LSEIQKVEAEISNQLQIQTAQNRQLNRQQNDLAALLQKRQQVYKSTENERRAEEKEVARLTKESRNIEDLMVKLKSRNQVGEGERRAAFGRFPGNVLAPVHGMIRIGFGEKDGMGAPSKGITFSTRPGASVVTPLAGIVKFAGPFQKYKQILIVEHLGGYHSLIAGLARIDTVVGASLAAGEPVGITETSGSPQVYYELRQDGKPINPQKSLVAQRKQEKG
jgi:septal ring factor EnvC (AmiA/AmiB activator)